ncbi:MAG TPA: protein kinase [Kofleriaceae bacterium]|nr:protein kinase [Kofleriaceae bacterium]
MAIELDDTAAPPPPIGVAATERPAPVVAEGTATAPGKKAVPSTPSDELPAGMRLGHFQLQKKLGAGGMGEVYLATDLALDRPVAIKVLPSGTSSGTARERLIREARAQARVQHPNVGHIYFIGEDQGRLYFAMEYVTGETLGERLAKGPMTAEDALAVIHDAVLGLREAQRSGFTHRDVKPSNLMVDNHGVVKVLDFGIAAGGTSSPDADASGPIAQTTLAGTPLYMAPEQARGEPIDFRADIYALGATLYQLVSGQPPFSADSVEKLITLHASADRPLIPKGRVPKTQQTALDTLISRMMASKPKDRFASYDDLLRAIENVSTQYTRPAGVWVRAIAFGIDITLLTIILSITLSLIGANDKDVPMGALLMPLLALVDMLLTVRFGSTPGSALFELQVVDVRTGARPGWRAALLRIAWSYGPLILLDWVALLYKPLHAPDRLQDLTKVAYVAWMVMVAYRLVHASLRVPGKRAPWDRRSNTMVRYRSGRR